MAALMITEEDMRSLYAVTTQLRRQLTIWRNRPVSEKREKHKEWLQLNGQMEEHMKRVAHNLQIMSPDTQLTSYNDVEAFVRRFDTEYQSFGLDEICKTLYDHYREKSIDPTMMAISDLRATSEVKFVQEQTRPIYEPDPAVRGQAAAAAAAERFMPFKVYLVYSLAHSCANNGFQESTFINLEKTTVNFYIEYDLAKYSLIEKFTVDTCNEIAKLIEEPIDTILQTLHIIDGQRGRLLRLRDCFKQNHGLAIEQELEEGWTDEWDSLFLLAFFCQDVNDDTGDTLRLHLQGLIQECDAAASKQSCAEQFVADNCTKIKTSAVNYYKKHKHGDGPPPSPKKSFFARFGLGGKKNHTRKQQKNNTFVH